MVEKRKRGRPSKKDLELRAMQAKGTYKDSIAVRKAKAKAEATKEFELSLEKARNKAREELNQKRESAVNLRYVAERLRDIKNMDEVEAFYKECVYNIGINTLRNGEADG